MHIEINGASLFFDTVGARLSPENDGMVERPTLLMLHGGPGFDHTTLRPYFDRYADAMQVIYIDHRGCGRSTGTADTLNLDQWADDIAEFCAVLGINRPVVFGQSFGGMVAMHYGARFPDGPSKLILSSTAARFDLQATTEMARSLGGDVAADAAQRFFSDPSAESYDVYKEVCLPLYSRTPAPDGVGFRNRAIEKPDVAIDFFASEMKAMDMRAEIAAIDCPTLVLGGAQDPVTPVVCSKEIAGAIGDAAQLEIFENCGHGVHRDDPDGAEAVMRAFLNG